MIINLEEETINNITINYQSDKDLFEESIKNNTKQKIARVIRRRKNAQLVRQITAMLKEKKIKPPSQSTLFEILRKCKAGKPRSIQGKC